MEQTQDRVRVVGIAGSLREGSYNKMLLAESKRLAPEGLEIEFADISGFPLFNADLESSYPDVVAGVKEKIRVADGVLIVTPEYNFSFTGVIKNAIDWLSRPDGGAVFENKPVALQSASMGWAGGVRAQLHLKQVLAYFPMNVMHFPEVHVGQAHQKFGLDKILTDEFTILQVSKQLSAFKKFIMNAQCAPASRS